MCFSVLECGVCCFLSSFCNCVFQSNSLPGHVKINVTRENLFEGSFQQVFSFSYAFLIISLSKKTNELYSSYIALVCNLLLAEIC